MIIAGLKLVLGLLVGSFLFSGLFAFAIGSAELSAYWRRKRQPHSGVHDGL